MIEKRKYKRHPFHLETEVYRLADSNDLGGEFIRCRCRDISNGGLSFYSPQELKEGELIRVRIMLPASDFHEIDEELEESISILAKVIYSNCLPDDEGNLTGICFLNIYQQDFDILCSHIVENMSKSEDFRMTSSSLCLSKKHSVKQIK